jgi:hypothetical protein
VDIVDLLQGPTSKYGGYLVNIGVTSVIQSIRSEKTRLSSDSGISTIKEREMDYNETKELEKNIKIKNEAEDVYKKFLNNIKLEAKNYSEGRFLFWSDSHNATYFAIKDGHFIFQCRFLHETYNVTVTKEALFGYIKNNYRGYDHFKTAVSLTNKS